MTGSICPEHHNLVHELALGQLDDARAVRAEALRVDCDHCRGWWDATFAGEAFAAVDQSAESAFATFRAPAKRRYGWLAAAAALVLTVGIGSMSLLLRDTGTEFSRAATPVPVGATLTVMDFESGSLEAVVGASNSAETVAVDHQEGVFRSDLESGDLGSWSSHS